MFQFSGLALFRVIYLQYTRLSHSEIFGLALVCSYPKLIAAYHVLHRLPVPRHPPCALIHFKYFIILKRKSSDLRPQFSFLLYYFLLTRGVRRKIAFPICQRSSPATLITGLVMPSVSNRFSRLYRGTSNFLLYFKNLFPPKNHPFFLKRSAKVMAFYKPPKLFFPFQKKIFACPSSYSTYSIHIS